MNIYPLESTNPFDKQFVWLSFYQIINGTASTVLVHVNVRVSDDMKVFDEIAYTNKPNGAMLLHKERKKS